jgi:nucleotide-binding universal stress UspA family protein
MTTRQRVQRKIRKTIVRSVDRAATKMPDVLKPVRPVLVATDGSRAAGAAIKFARAMADTGVWQPEVVTVLQPLPITVADVALPGGPILAEPALTGGVIGAIRRQLRRLGAASWDFRVEFGTAARSIVSLAHASQAQLIVIGLGKHGKLARLFGAETAARICRLTDTPVLAVEEHAGALPHTAVVAMDFGDSSVRAAREALALLQPPARLHLLHVDWTINLRSVQDPGWDRTYAAGVEHGFERLRKELAPPKGIEITSELRDGGVIEGILKVASEVHADVLAVGSHSQKVIDRLLIGSTPALLLRAARCSVLIAPPVNTSDSSTA